MFARVFCGALGVAATMAIGLGVTGCGEGEEVPPAAVEQQPQGDPTPPPPAPGGQAAPARLHATFISPVPPASGDDPLQRIARPAVRRSEDGSGCTMALTGEHPTATPELPGPGLPGSSRTLLPACRDDGAVSTPTAAPAPTPEPAGATADLDPGARR
jgi:hypothetical protein